MTKETQIPVWRSRLELKTPENFSPGEEPLWPLGYDPAPVHTLYQDPDKGTLTFEVFLYFEPDQNDQKLLTRAAEDFLGVEIEPLFFAALKPRNWVLENQKNLKPIQIGRYFVYGAHDAKKVPDDKIPLLIEAGMAFGTGQHETTKGCLIALEGLAKKHTPETALDLGCGSGILAFAMNKTWPSAKILASDNDRIAVRTAIENAEKNNCQGIEFITSEGFSDPCFSNRTFDLIMANILAGPLIALAPEVFKHTNSGGTVVLSGLMDNQTDHVLKVYEDLGFDLKKNFFLNNWAVLVLKKP